MDNHKNGCLICGAELAYHTTGSTQTCHICGKSFEGNASCVHGHFVCDRCHSFGALAEITARMDASTSRDAIQLFEEAVTIDSVHMHGPEHHAIVPFSLLTAYKNAGMEMDYDRCLAEISNRAAQVPGGSCGFWGVCGSASGAGIFLSVITDSSPLNKEMWHVPMELTSKILARLAEVGGPRCCKRTCRIAIEEAVKFYNEMQSVQASAGHVICKYHDKNHECIGVDCPYWE